MVRESQRKVIWKCSYQNKKFENTQTKNDISESKEMKARRFKTMSFKK